MAHRYSQEKLTTLLMEVQNPVGQWRTAVDGVKKATDNISTTAAMKGKGPDNVKQYMQDVHGSIYTSFAALFAALEGYVSAYNNAYYTLDGSTSAIIDEYELSDYASALGRKVTASQQIEQSVKNILASVDDICYIPFQGTLVAEDAMRALKTRLETLNQDIADIETKYQGEPQSEIEQLINSLTAFIREEIARKDIAGYTRQSLIQSTAFGNLVTHCNTLIDRLNQDAELIKAAYENQNEMFETLQEEYEERQKKAKVLTAVVAVVGVVATVATAGAAAPVVVGTAAVVGAVTAGVNCAANMYVGTLAGGGMDKIDWGTVATHAAIGGVTGAVTSSIGLGADAVSSQLMGKVTSSAGKVVIKGAVSGANSCLTGMVNRTATTYMETGSLQQSIDAALDGKQMLADTAGGFAGGAVSQYVTGKMDAKIQYRDKMSKSQKANMEKVQGVLGDKGSNMTRNQYLRASNTIKRAVHGGAINLTENVANRFAKTMVLSDGDLGQSMSTAFDAGEMATDFTLGSVSEMSAEYKQTRLGPAEQRKIQKKIDAAAQKYNNPEGKLSAAEQTDINLRGKKQTYGVKSGKNGTPDFSDTPAIARTPSGEPVEVKIKVTPGNYQADFREGQKQTKLLLGEGGGQKVVYNKNGTVTIGKKTYTYHHMGDYDVSTGECTMQLVETKKHDIAGNHSGAHSMAQNAKMEEKNTLALRRRSQVKRGKKLVKTFTDQPEDASSHSVTFKVPDKINMLAQ